MITTSCAVTLFRKHRAWFGSAIVFFGGRCVDGRQRQAALALLPPSLRGRIEPVQRVARSSSEVAALLALAGHPDRAVAYLSPMADSIDTIVSETWLPRNIAAEVYAIMRRRKEHPTRPHRHVRWKRRYEKMRSMLEKAAGCVGLEELDDIERQITAPDARLGAMDRISLSLAKDMLDMLQAMTVEAGQSTKLSLVIRSAVMENLEAVTTDYLVLPDGCPRTTVSVRVDWDTLQSIHRAVRRLRAGSSLRATSINRSSVVRACLARWLDVRS